METSIIVAIVGILGVIVGASLQSFFQRRIETSKQLRLLQTQAYVDFVKGVAGVTKAKEFGNREKELEFISLVADSKTRISIYGNSKVAKKLAQFFRDYSETISEEGAKSFTELIQLMREDSLSIESDISKKEIEEILFSAPKNK
jgi:type II secretory pathway pseudopilin PulG